MVWKSRGSGAVILGDLGIKCGRVTVVYLVFHPLGVRAELLVRTHSGIVYLGHLYAGESGQFCPVILLGPMQCFVGPDATDRGVGWVQPNPDSNQTITLNLTLTLSAPVPFVCLRL